MLWRFKVALCKSALLKSTRLFNKVGYFSNRVVYTELIKNNECQERYSNMRFYFMAV
jgi:hypothetical protein